MLKNGWRKVQHTEPWKIDVPGSRLYRELMQPPTFVTARGALYDGDALLLLPDLVDRSLDLVILDAPEGRAGQEVLEAVISDTPRLLKPTGSLFAFGASETMAELWVKHRSRFSQGAWLVWHHGRGSGRGKNWVRSYETILHLQRDEFALRSGSSVTTDVLAIPRVSGAERMHSPSQKPLALLRTLIGVSTRPGDLVFDPFAGSGTTLLASEQLERSWIGCEIDGDSRAFIEGRFRRGGRIQATPYKSLSAR